jgi:hypothetical protein
MTRKRKPVRAYSQLKAVLAVCQDCRWVTETPNGMAQAKQHAATYGHAVHVEQTIRVRYLPEGHPSQPATDRRARRPTP